MSAIPLDNMLERSFYETLGAQMKEKRKVLKIKRPELAEKIGITEQSLGLYERGLVRIPLYRFAEICKILQIEPYRSIFPITDTSQLALDFDTEKPIEK